MAGPPLVPCLGSPPVGKCGSWYPAAPRSPSGISGGRWAPGAQAPAGRGRARAAERFCSEAGMESRGLRATGASRPSVPLARATRGPLPRAQPVCLTRCPARGAGTGSGRTRTRSWTPEAPPRRVFSLQCFPSRWRSRVASASTHFVRLQGGWSDRWELGVASVFNYFLSHAWKKIFVLH